jgi:hypothetical protein
MINEPLTDDQLRIERELQDLDEQKSRHKLELDRLRSELEDLKIDRELKKTVAKIVFVFLGIESILLFVVLFFQGFAPSEFHIGDRTLEIFLPATIIQISSMAVIVTKYLFSKRE